MQNVKLEMVSSDQCKYLNCRVAECLQLKSARFRFPGHPVNVFMPHYRFQLQDPELWASPKTDGTRFLLFFDYGQLWFADSSYQWYSPCLESTCSKSSCSHDQLHPLLRSNKSYIVDGEWFKRNSNNNSNNNNNNIEKNKPQLYLFDVFMFRGVCVRQRNFAERFKFAPQIADAFNDSFPYFTTFIKPFFCARDQLGYIVDHIQTLDQSIQKFGTPSDGIIFQHSHIGLRPIKFKEVFDITVDFELSTFDWKSLYLSATTTLATSSKTEPIYIDQLAEPIYDQIRHQLLSTNKHVIVECRFDETLNVVDPHPNFPLEGQWVFDRYRPHKQKSNPQYVLRRNITLIQAAFTGHSLKQIASRYSLANQTTTENGYFQQDPIKRADAIAKTLPLKRYHNWTIKHILYRQFLKHRSFTIRDVCELGIGRGADLKRLLDHASRDLYSITGLDVDQSALNECQKRWTTISKTFQKQRKDQRISLDLKKVDLSDLAEVDEVCRYSKFDLVVANFCIHYFRNQLIAVLQKLLLPNRHCFMTFFDRNRVHHLVPEIGQEVSFDVDGSPQAKIRRISETKIGVWFSTIGKEHEEELVDRSQLIQDMQNAQFDLVFDRFFDDEWWYQRQREIECEQNQQDHKDDCEEKFSFDKSHPLWAFSRLNCALAFQRCLDYGYSHQNQNQNATNKTKKAKKDDNDDNVVSPKYSASSPQYSASSPQYSASSPPYSASSPVFTASSPPYSASSPVYTTSSS